MLLPLFNQTCNGTTRPFDVGGRSNCHRHPSCTQPRHWPPVRLKLASPDHILVHCEVPQNAKKWGGYWTLETEYGLLRPKISLVYTGLNQQGYVNVDSCKSVHRTLAPGNSKDNSTPASWLSYGKYRTRVKVLNRTFTPENSQYSVIQGSMKREIKGQDRGISGAMITTGTILSSSPTGPSLTKPAHDSCRYPTVWKYPSTRPRLSITL